MLGPSEKSSTAFRTISEVAAEVGVPQHVLRFWESRFTQISPLKRGGNRRYYRPADVALLQTINRLLYSEGYTIRGVQQLLARGTGPETPAALPPARVAVNEKRAARPVSLMSLPAIRAQLAEALAAARAL